MNPDVPRAPLQASGIFFGAGSDVRRTGWSATFPAGLSLIVDEETEAKMPLLRLLAGEISSGTGTGTVLWHGAAVAALPEAERSAHIFWRDPRAPWPEISPTQWAHGLAARYPTWSAADWQAHVQGLGLVEHLHKEMFRLSTGSKRKVLLAAALASGAPLTLIDEPEAALDRASIRHLRGMLADEARRCGETGRVFVVAHYERMPDVPWAQVLCLP